MFFPPATHGLVRVESGDLMASEIVPVPCECWATANLNRGKRFARAYDIFLNFRGRSRVQDRMIWIGTQEGRDCYALQTYRLCCKWFAPQNRHDMMIQMCTLVLLLRPALAHLFQLRLMFQYFRKTAGARKPRRVAGC
jgi:hypothetical protein